MDNQIIPSLIPKIKKIKIIIISKVTSEPPKSPKKIPEVKIAKKTNDHKNKERF